MQEEEEARERLRNQTTIVSPGKPGLIVLAPSDAQYLKGVGGILYHYIAYSIA